MDHFYTGLCIVKNLLRTSKEVTCSAIMEYEQVCIDQRDDGWTEQRKGFLAFLEDALKESMSSANVQDAVLE